MPLFLRRSFIIIFCLLCAGLQPVAFSTRAAEPVTAAQWQQLTNDKAFDYKNDKESVKPPVQPANTGWLIQFLRAIIAFFSAAKYLIWAIIITGILYIIYKIFAGSGSFMFRKNKKVMNDESPPESNDEDIASTNWEALSLQAINNNDLRLAVRYRYMWLLQLLQKNELIHYRNDKTNYEYYTELRETSYKQPFKQLSRQYEYAWYGHFTLSPAAYAEYEGLFNNLRKQLGA